MSLPIPNPTPQPEAGADAPGTAAFALAQRQARALAESGLLPARLATVPGALQVMALAEAMRLPVMAVAQNLFEVRGKIGWSAVFIAGLANSSGKLKANLRFTLTGAWPSVQVTCSGSLHGDPNGTSRDVTLGMSDAKELGWLSGTGWKGRAGCTHMLTYRAATWWVRENMPEVLMGFGAVEELRDVAEEQDAVQAPPVMAMLPEPPADLEPEPEPEPTPEPEPIPARRGDLFGGAS